MATNFAQNFFAGQQDAVQNQVSQLALQRAQRVNALAGNPNATPEQYVRAGDTATGNALESMQQSQQTDTAQAVTQLATIAKQAATIAQNNGVAASKQFTQQAVQTYGPHFKTLGIDVSQSLGALSQMPDDQYLQSVQRAAQMLPPNYQKLGPGETIRDINQPGAPALVSTPGKVDFKNTGGEQVPVDSVTGQPRPDVPTLKNTPPPGQQYTTDSVEQTAQLIANGQIPALSGFAMRSPWGQQVMARVGQINPDYTSGTNVSRVSTMRAFTSGTEGRTVRSLNVAISHLDTLSGLADALNNGDIQRVNQASNVWKTETGNPAPTSFTSARDIVANEVVKAVTASGGSLADRQEAQRQIQAAASPAQLTGVIKTWQQLLGGQLEGLRQQYEQGTSLKDFDKYLSPRTKQVLEPPAPPPGNGPVQIKSDADYNALPSGTEFIAPDGSHRKKP